MAILTLQRRQRELGRIRLGERGSKNEPRKLSHFRLTSPARHLLEHAAALWGGEVREWVGAPTEGQYELYTKTDVLPIIVPPGPEPVSQFYEQWKAGGCTHRCDGVRNHIDDSPCSCDPDNRACKPTTRVNLMLPDLPDVGVWRLETHGMVAAMELPGLVDMLAMPTRVDGLFLAGRLRIEHRTSKKNGQTHKFIVPVIDLDVSVRQLASSQAPDAHPALPAGGEDGEAPDTSPSREAPAAAVEPPASPEKGPTIKQVEYLWIIAGEKYGQKRKEQVVRTIMADLAPGVESTKDLTSTQYEAVLDAVAAGQDPHADALFGDAA